MLIITYAPALPQLSSNCASLCGNSIVHLRVFCSVAIMPDAPPAKRARRGVNAESEADAVSAGVRADARAQTSAASIPPGISAEEHAAAMQGVAAEVSALTRATGENGIAPEASFLFMQRAFSSCFVGAAARRLLELLTRKWLTTLSKWRTISVYFWPALLSLAAIWAQL